MSSFLEEPMRDMLACDDCLTSVLFVLCVTQSDVCTAANPKVVCV